MTDEAVYCLTCGREAHQPERSMDPLHPIVLCRYQVKRNGRPVMAGCGHVSGTYSRDEAVLTLLNRQAVKARKAHQAGKHEKRPVRGCDRCLPAVEHRKHVRARKVSDTCVLCTLAQDRTAPVRHAR